MNTLSIKEDPDAPKFHPLTFYGIFAMLFVVAIMLYRSGIAASSAHQANVLSNGMQLLLLALKERLPIIVVTYYIWIVVLAALLGYTFIGMIDSVKKHNYNDSFTLLVKELTLASCFVMADISLGITAREYLIYFITRLVIMLAVGVALAFFMCLPFYGFMTGAKFHKHMTSPGSDGVARLVGGAMVFASIMTALFV